MFEMSGRLPFMYDISKNSYDIDLLVEFLFFSESVMYKIVSRTVCCLVGESSLNFERSKFSSLDKSF